MSLDFKHKQLALGETVVFIDYCVTSKPGWLDVGKVLKLDPRTALIERRDGSICRRKYEKIGKYYDGKAT